MPIKMKRSQDVTDLVRSFEGCRLDAYWDSLGSCWTIGFGHTNGVVKGMKINLSEAYHFLNEDLDVAETYVNKMVVVPLTQSEFDALVDFTYNLGWVRLHNSTLLHLVNDEKFHDAANEFQKWCYASGKRLAGLLKRRQAEQKLFESDGLLNA